jgi:hypothetical protein
MPNRLDINSERLLSGIFSNGWHGQTVAVSKCTKAMLLCKVLSQTCDARLWWLFGELRGNYLPKQCKSRNERHCYS